MALWKAWLAFWIFWLITELLFIISLIVTSYDAPTFEFMRRLESARRNNQKLELKELTNFTWEKVCFIEPYMTEDIIRQTIGTEYALSPIDTGDEGAYYLLFALPDKRTASINVPRENYQRNHTSLCLSYNESEGMTFHY